MKEFTEKTKQADFIHVAWESQIRQVGRESWKTAVLHPHYNQLYVRFRHFYSQLSVLPRWIRRRLKRKLAITVAGAALMLALSRLPAQANSIMVVDGEVAINANGLCSLVEAIENANDIITGQPHTDCAAGDPSGIDTIYLPSDGQFVLMDTYGSSVSGLPDIASPLTIEGKGSTINRDSSAPSFAILQIAPMGNLTINEATISGGSRGGIFNYGGNLTINESTISGNTNSWGGGGVLNYGVDGYYPTVTINNSTISGNTALFGGGVANWNFGWYGGNNATLIINNSTISGNTADYGGGGVYNYGYFNDWATLVINHSTITGNEADIGGGVYERFGESFFNRSIFSGNIAQVDREVRANEPVIDNFNIFGYSSDGGTVFTPGDSDIVPDERIVQILDSALKSNGGPTETHALVPGSPAIDGGPVDGTCLVTDQRGLARPQGPACDIGAFEFVSIETLQDYVQELVDTTALTSQQGRAMTRLLSQTERLIQRNQVGRAVTSLNNFIAKINQFISLGILTQDEGQPVIDAAQALIDTVTP